MLFMLPPAHSNCQESLVFMNLSLKWVCVCMRVCNFVCMCVGQRKQKKMTENGPDNDSKLVILIVKNTRHP